MSGGHFDYTQYHISRIAEKIEQQTREEYYPPEILVKFKEAIQALNIAYVYAQRIDWYLSGDDGDESFLRRLSEDLEQAKK